MTYCIQPQNQPGKIDHRKDGNAAALRYGETLRQTDNLLTILGTFYFFTVLRNVLWVEHRNAQTGQPHCISHQASQISPTLYHCRRKS